MQISNHFLASKTVSSENISNKNRGFTLIEVLVSIAIFASLSIAAYTVLNQTQRSNQISLEKTERLKEIQRAMVIIDNDFRQIALRQFRTNGEDASENIIVYGEGLLDSEDKGVAFTRLGWQNPQQMFPRGEITKVGYRIVANQLERVWWRYPDTPVGQEGIVTPLLDKVDEIEVSFYTSDDEWTDSWQEHPLELPRAISFKLLLEDYDEIERVYLTAGERLQTESNNGDANE